MHIAKDTLFSDLKKDFFRVIKNDNFADNVVVAVVTFITRFRGIILLPLITKRMGISEYGVWIQFLTISNLISEFFLFNFHTYIVRHIPEEQELKKQGEIYVSTLTTMVLLNTTFILIIILFNYTTDAGQLLFHDKQGSLYFFLACSTGQFMSLISYNLNFYRAIQKISFQVILNASITTSELIGILVCLFFGTLETVCWFILSWRIICAIFMSIFVFHRIPVTRPKLDRMNNCIAFSSPLFFSNISAIILSNADKLMIGTLGGSVALGLYSVSTSIATFITSIISPFQITLLPKISLLWNKNKQSAVKLVENYCNFFLVSALPCFIIFLAFGDHVLELFSKGEASNIDNYIVLLVVSCGNIFYGLAVFEIYVLYGQKRTGTISILRTITASCNVLFNFLLIPKFGYLASGLISFSSNLFLFCGTRYCSKSMIQFPFKGLFICLLVTWLMIEFIFLLRINFESVVISVTTFTLYFFLYFASVYCILIKLKRKNIVI